MKDPYERLGRPANVTEAQIRWFNQMLTNKLGRTIVTSLITHGPNEFGKMRTRSRPLLSAYVNYPDGLRLLWTSESKPRHPIHSLHIFDKIERAIAEGGREVAEVELSLVDSGSRDVSLNMFADARPVPQDRRERDLAILNAVRDEYRVEYPDLAEVELGGEDGRMLYEAVITEATTQGPRVDDQGRRLHEGNPVVDFSLLRGHDVTGSPRLQPYL